MRITRPAISLLCALVILSPTRPPTATGLSELWIEPERPRDLYDGVGGPQLAPSPLALYKVLEVKKGGFSDGYTVADPKGREWSAKLYPEARTEVVASRILWALGYHQPPVYTLERWSAEGAKGPNPQPVARFREEEARVLRTERVRSVVVFRQPVRRHEAAGGPPGASGDAGQF